MSRLNRREFLRASCAVSSTGLLFRHGTALAKTSTEGRANNLHLATFRFDVTPPVGHSCCGGWIKPVVGVDDPLEAIGFVLLGAGRPIVVCAVDWTGLLNEAHVAWRAALADAAGTTPERVAVQCVHQHNAPFACLDAERIVTAQGDLPHIVDVDFYRRCLDRARGAVAESLRRARPVTHVAHGQAKVEKVASNRRVCRDDNGHVGKMRGSSCRDPELRALPEGLIDPWLKTVVLYDKETKLAACHYYATHPMSYYGDGRVTSDFAGLARRRRQQDEPHCLHVYFTGCAGNIAAGKYNDGSSALRSLLTDRVYDGIVQSERQLKPVPVARVSWKTVDILPPPHSDLVADVLAARIADKRSTVVDRSRPAYKLAWLQRMERRQPIVLSRLQLDGVSLLHLPSECFIQYQLRAQRIAPSQFVATAAYGDGGPWYIPVEEEYALGGYEVSVAFCDPEVDSILDRGMRMLAV